MSELYDTDELPEGNFPLYFKSIDHYHISGSQINTALASGHFQNYGVVQPSLYFKKCLTIKCLENKIGVEFGENG